MYLPSDPKIWNEVRRDKLIKTPKFWLPILVILLILLIIPNKTFYLPTFIESWVKTIAKLVPSVNTWMQRSYYPGATQLLFSLIWSLIPYYSWLIFKEYFNTEVNDKKLLLWKNIGWKRHFLPFSVFLLFLPIVLIFYFYALPENPDCNWLCIHKSLLLQFAYAFCWSFAISFFFAFIYFWLKIFKQFHF